MPDADQRVFVDVHAAVDEEPGEVVKQIIRPSLLESMFAPPFQRENERPGSVQVLPPSRHCLADRG